jgi:hypothetical protein
MLALKPPQRPRSAVRIIMTAFFVRARFAGERSPPLAAATRR